MSKTILRSFVLVFMLCFATTSWGALTGMGSIGINNGLYASGDHWTSGGSLSWNVFQLTTGNYEYDYTFAVTDKNAKNISHVILQMPAGFTQADILSGTTANGILGTWNNQGNSNPGIPTAFYGIKWDVSVTPTTSFNWTIITDRAPGMGNFYAKDGNAGGAIYAYSGTSGAFGNNVVVPNSVVPIPAAFLLFGSGLAGMVVVKTRILKNNSK